MSQHKFVTQHPAHGRVEVLAGWDRPLQGYFMVVEKMDVDEDAEEEAYVYSNLADPNLPVGGMADSFTYFVEVLARLGIRLPARMIADVMADGRENVGNKTRDWSDYTPETT